MEKMKKLIVMSMVASSILFAANVDGLKINQENEVERTEMNSAQVSQGETKILEDADVLDLSIKEKDDGNLIDDAIINADGMVDVTDPGFDDEPYNRKNRDTIITQGKTIIVDGKVDDVKINSDSTITDATITSFGKDSLEIDQGFTLVEGHGQQLTDAKITSDNTISNVEIEGGNRDGTKIKQANFLMLDEGDASKADDIEIDTTNVIDGGKIGQADIKQAVTQLTDGAVAENFNVKQHNNIEGDTEIQDYSEISQGVTTINDATISKLDQTVTNIIADVKGDSSLAVDSKIKQADINVQDDSDVALVYLDHTNTIRNAELQDSTITQDTLLAVDDSVVRNFKQQANNSVVNVTAEDSSIKQNALLISNSTLDGRDSSVSIQNNEIKDSHLLDSRLSQASILIKDSDVIDLSVSEDNKVHDSSLRNAVLTQGRLVIR
jgi:hypothetical protein